MTPHAPPMRHRHTALAFSLSVLLLAGCGQQALPLATAPADPPADMAGAPLPDEALPAEPSEMGDAAPALTPHEIALASSSRGSGGGSSGAAPVAQEEPDAPMGAMTLVQRSPNTTPITNIAGMNAARHAPTARSTFMDVTPDGQRVAVAWLTNRDERGNFSLTGEPVTYVTVGDPRRPTSFSAPRVIGQRTLAYAASATNYHKGYNSAHNAPFVVSTSTGGFVGLSVPMNANGYAENLPATKAGYAQATLASGATAWSAIGQAMLTNQPGGSSLSEMTGNADAIGGIHLFGQGHRGQFQGGLGYQRRRPNMAGWDSTALSAAYRATGINYFSEGGGYASRVKNAQGQYDVHAAFAWNQAGIKPLFGLSYVVSHDGGTTWQTAAGKAAALPVRHNDAGAAVFLANLTSTAYGGSTPGHSAINVGATDDGAPLIIRPNAVGALKQVQHRLYTYAAGRWVSVNVGPAVFWNANGNGIAYNARTGRVNVVLLDPGSYAKPARVLLYHQLLADVRAGKTAWTEEVVASVPQKHYASSLQVREVKNTRFLVMFESEFRNPGTVQPVLLEAPMR